MLCAAAVLAGMVVEGMLTETTLSIRDTESYFVHLSLPLRKKLMEPSVTPSA